MKAQSTTTQLRRGRVDPAIVPQRVLYTGARIPAIGLGTFGSDHVHFSRNTIFRRSLHVPGDTPDPDQASQDTGRAG